MRLNEFKIKFSVWRAAFEKQFETLGRWLFHNRIKTILLTLLVVAGLAANLRKITIDVASEGLLHKDDPARLDYNAYRDQFGLDERIIIGINAPDVFNEEVLKKIQMLHKDLENEVPYVDDITSLINARNTRGEAEQLVVEDLLEPWPQSKEELKAIKNRALQNPLYRNMLLSEDGTFTAIIIQLDAFSSTGLEKDILEGFDDEQTLSGKGNSGQKYLTDKENSEAVDAVKKVIARHKSSELTLYLTGSSVVTDLMRRAMRKDMLKFIRLVVATIALFLILIFRRISGVVLPLLGVILSVVCTFGLMALTGTPIKMPTQILPSFLLAVGVGASVHLLTIFFRRFDETGDKENALAYALGHSGLAIMMTSLTTAAGLGSFATAYIAPIADLGRFAALGVLISLVFTLALLPALLALLPLRRKKPPIAGKSPLMDRLLRSNAAFSVKYAKSILWVSAVMIIISLLSASGLRFSHNQLEWFPESDPTRKSTEAIDKAMNGSISMEVVVNTGQENGLHDPKLLNALDELCIELETIKGDGYFVGKAWSLPTILKEINKALNENRAEFYTIPRERDLIAQELLLFENSGSDDLEDVVDSKFSKTRVTIKLPWVDAMKYEELISVVKKLFERKLGDSAAITVTGISPIMGKAFSASIRSAAKSYFIAFGVITMLMILLIGNVRIGLVSMIPNILPILAVTALMMPFRLPLDMFTMLVGSIAIGLAVDNTIHFIHNFNRYYGQTGNAHEAVLRTFITTGRAMLTASIVLSLGFFVYMFAYMNHVSNFGLLTGLAIIIALLADFFLTPALMVLITRHDKGGKPL